MFAFDLLKGNPWERNIPPDSKNDKVEIYIEKRATELLITNKNTKRKIKKMRGMQVALVRFLDTMKHTWVILDSKGVLQRSDSYEGILYLCDAYRFIYTR